MPVSWCYQFTSNRSIDGVGGQPTKSTWTRLKWLLLDAFLHKDTNNYHESQSNNFFSQGDFLKEKNALTLIMFGPLRVSCLWCFNPIIVAWRLQKFSPTLQQLFNIIVRQPLLYVVSFPVFLLFSFTSQLILYFAWKKNTHRHRIKQQRYKYSLSIFGSRFFAAAGI